MPGVIFSGGPRFAPDSAAQKLQRLRPQAELQRIGSASGSFAVWLSAYEHYPFRVVEDADCIAIVDGTILRRPATEVDATLRTILKTMAHSPADARTALTRWAASESGDFVITAVCGSTVLVVTDQLGRLPVYVAAANGVVTAARESKFCEALCGPFDIDRRAVAEMLMFGSPLDGRTLLAGVRRLPPAAVLTIELESACYSVTTYYAWNFEELVTLGGGRKTVDELVEKFTRACSEQSTLPGFDGLLLSLSGGLDSRAVAAALHDRHIPFTAVTNKGRARASLDAQIAERVATSVQVPWQLIELDPPDWDDVVATVRLRDGLTYIGHAGAVQYYRGLLQRFGTSASCLTGDGGDKAFPDLRSPWWIRSIGQFVEYRLRGAVWDPSAVAAILGVPESRVRADAADYFSSYPERNAAYYDVRFLLRDRAMTQNFEGEERNRSFLWVQSPFFEREFFLHAMSIEMRAKANHALYREFQERLNKQLASLENARWNAPMGSRSAYLSSLRERLPRLVPPALRDMTKGLRKMSPAKQYVAPTSDAVAEKVLELLSTDAVRAVFKGPAADYARQCRTVYQFRVLATIAIYIAERQGTLT